VNFLADPQEGRSTCFYNQHAFITFAFYTFGFLAPEVVDLLNRVQKVMHSNIVSHKSMDVVFKRMSFAIQKSGSGAACCPITFYSYVIKLYKIYY
jgi:hypothetical protein